MKIALLGSNNYGGQWTVKEFIFKRKQEFGDKLTLILGGKSEGFDAMTKKISVAFGINYELYPPFHFRWNWHCPLPAYMYGKPYDPKYFFQINSHIVKASDVITVFLKDGIETKVTKDIMQKAKKAGKPLLVTN